MSMGMYTEEELITKIKDIDTSLGGGLIGSKLGTGQTDNEITLSLAQMQKQRNYYINELQRSYPDTYRSYYGSGVTRFTGHHHG